MIVYRVLPATNGHQGTFLTIKDGSARLYEQRWTGTSWSWYCDTGRHSYQIPALPFDPADAVDACAIAGPYLGRMTPLELYQVLL